MDLRGAGVPVPKGAARCYSRQRSSMGGRVKRINDRST